jgi:hypothetical protein
VTGIKKLIKRSYGLTKGAFRHVFRPGFDSITDQGVINVISPFGNNILPVVILVILISSVSISLIENKQ